MMVWKTSVRAPRSYYIEYIVGVGVWCNHWSFLVRAALCCVARITYAGIDVRPLECLCSESVCCFRVFVVDAKVGRSQCAQILLGELVVNSRQSVQRRFSCSSNNFLSVLRHTFIVINPVYAAL